MLICDKSVKKWDIFTLKFTAAPPADPFEPGLLGAEFTNGGLCRRVEGFYDGGENWELRFMPESEGEWSYRGFGLLEGVEGSFDCLPAGEGVHGATEVAGRDFAYSDGTPYLPYGTTCYAWVYQTEEVRAKTLETLKSSPFNKIRMCVFPKYYVYNRRDPEVFPYERFEDGTLDYSRPNPAFFRLFEKQVEALRDIGVIADLIVFHPYDRWGFSRFPRGMDERYVRYLMARVGAYRNVWWAMANEYDFIKAFTTEDWNRIGNCFKTYDPYGHPRSIHNCFEFFDHSQPWITHISAQRNNLYVCVEKSIEFLEKWSKPLVWDEIAYEGNIPDGWGSITGVEMTRRFWEAAIRGAYPGHSETFIDADDGGEDKLLWWSHGGELHGESPARIAFLYDIMAAAPRGRVYDENWDLPYSHKGGDWYLFYHTFMQPVGRSYLVEARRSYHVEVIDTWAMTIEDRGIVAAEPLRENPFRDVAGLGRVHVTLPGKQFMAVRLTAVE